MEVYFICSKGLLSHTLYFCIWRHLSHTIEKLSTWHSRYSFWASNGLRTFLHNFTCLVCLDLYYEVQAHMGITGNELADDLANEGNNLEKPEQTPHIHIARPTPYWLASCPTGTHDGAIRNLRTFITKTHDTLETALAINKFPYVDKWLSNTQINQKLSNHFWNNDQIPDTQITQTLKF